MSKIEWTYITRNPVKGKCPTACPYCYAREIYDNNKWDPAIRFHPEVLDDLPKKPCRVFVGSTIELFLYPVWLPAIFDRCRRHPEHTFIFLTKKPEELPLWSPFPENCQVGVTVTNDYMMPAVEKAFDNMWASERFISFEPLLGPLSGPSLKHIRDFVCQLVIIGAMSGRKGKLMQLQKNLYPQLRLEKLGAIGQKWTLLPRLEWVRDIVLAADAAGIPVFIKDNLYKLMMEAPAEDHDLYWEDMANLRQELPERRVKV